MRIALVVALLAAAVKGDAEKAHLQKWPNGMKRVEGTLRFNKRHGVWRTWYESGKGASRSEYDRGVKVGRWLEWHANGGKRKRLDYDRKGRLHGFRTEWHANGRLHRSWRFESGRPMDGVEKVYHANGSLETAWRWANGRKADQMQVGYHANKKRAYAGKWHKGSKDGKWIHWYDSGVKARVVYYKAGTRHGVDVQWSRTGKKTSEREYRYGKLVQ